LNNERAVASWIEIILFTMLTYGRDVNTKESFKRISNFGKIFYVENVKEKLNSYLM